MAVGILRIGMAVTGAAGMPAIGDRGIIRIRIGEADIIITTIGDLPIIAPHVI